MDKPIKFIPKQIRLERIGDDIFRIVAIDEVDLCWEDIQLSVGDCVTFNTTWQFTISK